MSTDRTQDSLEHDPGPGTPTGRRARRRPARLRRGTGAAASLLVIALGVMHLALDGLTGVLVPLQPVLADRIGADTATLGLLVALALASASLLQPVTARMAMRWGDGRAAVAGTLLAAAGYGALPAVASTTAAAVAVVVGGLGSALFHPGAGAMVARAAPPGREALPLAVFSAVGTAGAALVPIVVLTGVDTLGAAAALPVAAVLVAVTAGLLFSRTSHAGRARPAPDRDASGASSGRPPRRSSSPVLVPVALSALISLTGVTVNATAPLLLARTVDATDPLLGYTVAAFSAAGALGGIALALWARRTRLTTVLLAAVGVGVLASLALPHVAAPMSPLVMLAAGAGLSGTLPLLVTVARRRGETSAAAAVARILGLAAGLGGLGYAGIGILQAVLGYGSALTLTAAVAGVLALLLITRVHDCDIDPDDHLHAAITSCGCGSCGLAHDDCQPQPA
ncbi:MAG: MFS transporter [Pseudonocardia sp.]|nr:MFS transporter [Pseudonocardia sp.]